MRTLLPILAVLPLLSACSSHHEAQQAATPAKSTFLRAPQAEVMPGQNYANGADLFASGDFNSNPAAQRFVDYMVSKHGYDRNQLQYWLGHAKRLDSVIALMERQAPRPPSLMPSTPPRPNGAWLRYRQQFITPDNLQNGVQFWEEHAEALQRAYKQYGVPPEIIVGIIGVETRWGRVMGKTRLLDALATLAFDYPRRADYFTKELETFLLMARDEHVDAHELRGSFAGAMGYCQFMPSSFKAYAVDFNNDGHVNLWDPEDAIGSVAHYFQAHGWTPNDTVAVRAIGQVSGMETGFKTRYPISALNAAGLRPTQDLGLHREASLLRLDMGTNFEYWYGLSNFYTITRYNNSVHYAMAVWQLGDAVKREVQGFAQVR